MIPVADQPHRLAEVRGADEEDIDVLDRRDFLDLIDGAEVLDLDGDEALVVGAFHVFGHRHGGEAAIDAGAVDAAQAARMELGPVDNLLGLGGAFDLGGHDAAGAGFERPHHRGVIGRGQPHERIEPGRPRCQAGVFDLGDRQRGMFLIEPDRIVAALLADDLDDLRMHDLTDAEDAHQVALCEGVFESFAHGFPLPFYCRAWAAFLASALAQAAFSPCKAMRGGFA